MKTLLTLSLTLLSLSSFAAPTTPPVTRCNARICVGDVVYRGEDFKGGATVINIRLDNKKALVRGNNNGNVHDVEISDLAVAKGCVAGICVGDLVNRDNNYSYGALVLAVNSVKNNVVVRSVKKDKIYTEKLGELYLLQPSAEYGNERTPGHGRER